jgi:hypothetical protein
MAAWVRRPAVSIAAADTERRIGHWSLPLLLLVPTLLLSAIVLWAWNLDGLYGQDPYAYFDYGVGAMRAFFLHGAHLTPFFWPLGYPVTVASFSLLLGPTTAAGQLASLASVAIAVLLTYRFGLDLLISAGAPQVLARRAATVGALLFGVAGWTLEAAVMVIPDGLAVATSLLSAWALLRWRSDENAGAGWIMVAGAALGWSVVTRWSSLVLLPLWLLVLLSSHPARSRGRLFAATSGVLLFAVILGIQLFLAFLVPTGPGLGHRPFVGDSGLLSGGGWSPGHLFSRSFFNGDGSQQYALPNAVYYALAPFRPKDLTPLAAFPLLAALWTCLSTYRRALIWLVGWPLIVLLLDAGLAEQNLRFVLAALPPLALLTGLGVALLFERFGARRPSISWLAITVGLIAVGAAGLFDMKKVAAAATIDRRTAAWAAAQTPSRSTLVSFELTETVAHSTARRPLDLSLVTAQHVQALADRAPTYLLVRVSAMVGQWVHRPAGETFSALRVTPGLHTVGTKNGYTLFRVQSR